MKNRCTVCVLQLGLWYEDAQTKRTCLRPWCGDDAYALSWGILTTQAMVGAKATPRHGSGKKQKKFLRNRLLFFLVQFYKR
jgi:hypothetical protein